MFTHREVTVPGAAVQADFKLIRSIPLFRYLEDTEVQKVLALAKRRRFTPGEQLITENCMGTETYILLRGRAEVIKDALVIGHLQPGDCVGEMAMFENAPRSASVRATEPGEIITFMRSDLYALFQNDSALAVKLLWSVCQTLNGRLRKTTEDLRRACYRKP